MESRLLQDLVTVRAAVSGIITQSSTSWLDVGDLEDVVIYTDCKEVTASPKIAFQTSATPLDATFVSLVPAQSLVATGVQTTSVLAAFAGVPPLRYLRWQFLGDGFAVSDATFRIWVAGYGWA